MPDLERQSLGLGKYPALIVVDMMNSFTDPESPLGSNADAVIEAKGLKQMSDSSELEAIVDQALADNADGVAQYKEADDKKRKKLLGGFMGPIMKATKGQANPGMVNQILVKKLNG